MACNVNEITKISHKEWRKEAKKLRRKKIRQKLAKARDRREEEALNKLLSNPDYQYWLQEQEVLEKFREEVEQREHEKQEELWMRRELLAQKTFLEAKKRQEAIEEAKEKERQRIQKEFEEHQKIVQQQIAEKRRLAEEKQKRHDLLMQKIDDFVNGDGELPEELYETADTNPAKDICPFFFKMASCRFGDKCTRNHSRPGISRMLLLPHFFTNIRLEQPFQCEYGSDLALEFSESELHQAYNEFFEDVTTELAKYGEIVNFRTCKNAVAHLRGNVFVEFKDERSSLRAYQRLQGRYYAGRRINVEFCKIVSWRTAICGLSLSRTCPKDANCNYLHIFKNPNNKYNVKDCPTTRSIHHNRDNASASKRTPSWDDGKASTRRNWRWSESPEKDTSGDKVHGSRPSPSRSRSRSNRSRERRNHSPRSRRRSRTRSKSPSRRSIRKSRSRSKSRSYRRRRSIRRSRSRSESPKRRRRDESTSSIIARKSPLSPKSSLIENRARSKERKSAKSCERKSRTRSKSKEKRKRKRRKRSKSKSRKNVNKYEN